MKTLQNYKHELEIEINQLNEQEGDFALESDSENLKQKNQEFDDLVAQKLQDIADLLN